MTQKIDIIGVGPGDPELLTLKGARIISEADIIVYAGSLIPPEVLSHAGENAVLYDSATMNLEEFTAVMVAGAKEGKRVVRLHSGDPSIYGAILEQMEIFTEAGVDFDVVPGVSSFLAAGAALKREFTVPGGSQTIILTRLAGRTPVPEKESLKSLASHHATMIIFLSSHMAGAVEKELLAEYPPDTPVAVVYKASRPDEKLIECELAGLSENMSREGISQTALIIVEPDIKKAQKSLLYDRSFTHKFRKAKT